MLVRTAEESFEKGLQKWVDGKEREAMAYFEAALELEKRFGKGRPQARYLSHYGLCLGTIGGRKHEAIRFCREAVEMEGYNPDLQLNLARVLLAANRRKEAHQALRRGLRQQPDHLEIVQELKRMGVRRRPPVGFLSRENPVNVMLGRLLTTPKNGKPSR